MAESFHQQVRKKVIPANKQDAYVYKFDSIGLERDPSKQHEGLWNTQPSGLLQYPLRTSPVKVWIFFYDHLQNIDILDGLLDNNPNQGVFGYCCQNPKYAKPEEMVFFLPEQKLPDSFKPGGIWVHPGFKLENLKKLDNKTAGFMVMGDKTEKRTKLDVGGQWKMLGFNQKVKLPKNIPELGGRRKKEPFGVKLRLRSKRLIFAVPLPSSNTKVDKLKDKIYSEKGIPSEDQRLTFEGTPLDDINTLKDCGIQNGDIIDLEPMEVYVENPSGTRFLFQVEPDEPVQELMEKVEEKEGTPIEQQILTFYEIRLEPNKTLDFYRIKHRNVIEMTVGPPVNKMRVFVEVPEDLHSKDHNKKNIIEINVPPNATFGHVKKLIEDQTEVPKSKQRVFFQDKEMKAKKPISKTKLKEGDTIRMEPAEVEVKMPDGTSRKFMLDFEEPVKDFKERLKTGFPSGTKLTFNDREMVDDDPMGKYDLNKRDVLLAEPADVQVDTPKGIVNLSELQDFTPNNIKEVIEAQTGVPKAQQRLFFFDEELVDEDKPIHKEKLQSMGTKGLKMEAEPVEVQITMPKGQSRAFFMDPADTVHDFKEKHRIDIPPGTKLIFNDVDLVDEELIGKYNLKKGDALIAEPDGLTVETPRGRVMLSLDSSMLAPSDIKDVIAEKTGVPKSQQRLFYFDDELLDDNKPLGQAKLTSLLGIPGLRMESIPTAVEVAMANGRTRMFIMDPEEKVGDLKKKNPRNFPPGTKLMFNDIELVDEEQLGKYNLKKGDVMTAEPEDGVVIETSHRGRVVLRLDSPMLTPSDIKDVVEEQTGVPKSQQRLFYFDEELPGMDDKKPLDKAKLAKLPGTHGLRMEPIPPTIEITMRNGKTRMFIIDPDETVGDFKKKHSKTHFLPGTKLTFNDVKLVDEEPLGKYNLKNGNVLMAEPEDEVAIETPRGKVVLSLDLPILTPSDIKDVIEEQTGVPKSQQRLFYFDEEQADNEKHLDLSKLRLLGTQGIRMDLVNEDDPEDPAPAKSRKARAFYQTEADEMEIMLSNGKKLKLSVLPTMTMKDLKKIIEEKIPAMKTNKQRMFTFDAADEIDDDTPISKLKLDSGRPLQLRPMEISVKHWNGRSFELPIAPSDYIEGVKEMLEELTGVEAAYLRLTHEGNKVDDTLRLDEQGIVNGSVLLLEQMRIFVNVPDGRRFRLRTEPKDTIKLIKKKIAKKTGLHYAKQSILLGGEDLDDTVTLAACGIDNGDEVTMEKFRIDIMDDSDGTVVTLADIARRDTIGLVRRQILKEFKRRVDPHQLYWQQIVSALDDSSSLKGLGIPHKSILVIRVPEEVAEEYKADRLRFKEISAKRFSDIDEDIIMPVEPDLRTRTFIFDNDASPIDGFITVSVLYWSGKKYKFDDLRPRETVKALIKRIKKRRKCPAFHLLLNGKVLKASGTLLDLGVGHKSFLVMERKKKKSIDELPQLDKVNLGALNSHAADKITLQIKMWNGKLVKLEIGATEYVDDIRDQLSDRLSIPAEYQLLSSGGDAVDDTLTLDEQNIKDGCLLVLEPLEIQINLPFKSTLMFKVEPEDTIASIKRKIEKRNSYSAKVQCLVFQGKVLGDSDTIMDCNVQHEDELDLELFVINILQLGGSRYTVSGSIHPGSTIGDVQQIIAKKQLVPTQLQKLRLHEKLLDPSTELSRQGVGHKSLLILEVSSTANVKKEEKIDKVQLQAPTAPPRPQRRMSSPELESPAIRVRKGGTTSKAPKRNKSLDTEDNFVERMNHSSDSMDLAATEAAHTKRVMLARKEEKKKVKRPKALDPVEETNHQAMNDSSGSLDLATATGDSEQILRARKARAELGSGGSKVRKARVKAAMENSEKSLDLTRAAGSGGSKVRVRKGGKKIKSKSVDPAEEARNLERVGKKKTMRPKSGNAVERSKSRDRVESMHQSAPYAMDLETADDDGRSKPLKMRDGTRTRSPMPAKSPTRFSRMGSSPTRTHPMRSSPTRSAKAPRRPADMHHDSPQTTGGHKLKRGNGKNNKATRPEGERKSLGVKSKEELSQMTIRQLKDLNRSLGGDGNQIFVEKSELVDHVHTQMRQAHKPNTRGRSPCGRPIRAKFAEADDRFGKETKESRVTIEQSSPKKENDTKKKGKGGWLKMFHT